MENPFLPALAEEISAHCSAGCSQGLAQPGLAAVGASPAQRGAQWALPGLWAPHHELPDAPKREDLTWFDTEKEFS